MTGATEAMIEEEKGRAESRTLSFTLSEDDISITSDSDGGLMDLPWAEEVESEDGDAVNSSDSNSAIAERAEQADTEIDMQPIQLRPKHQHRVAHDERNKRVSATVAKGFDLRVMTIFLLHSRAAALLALS